MSILIHTLLLALGLVHITSAGQTYLCVSNNPAERGFRDGDGLIDGLGIKDDISHWTGVVNRTRADVSAYAGRESKAFREYIKRRAATLRAWVAKRIEAIKKGLGGLAGELGRDPKSLFDSPMAPRGYSCVSLPDFIAQQAMLKTRDASLRATAPGGSRLMSLFRRIKEWLMKQRQQMIAIFDARIKKLMDFIKGLLGGAGGDLRVADFDDLD